MASPITLKTIGDWKQKIAIPLADVLNVSMDVSGRTGEEACRHAMILMAQSARATAKEAPRRRPVGDNPAFRHLLKKEQYKEQRIRGANMSAYYKYSALKLRQPPKPHREIFSNQRPRIAIIGNRGLLKRSWMWGLSKIGGKEPPGKRISGVSNIFSMLGEKVCGYVKTNRMSYVWKGMPPGWETTVEQKAGNKIMAQAAMKIERQWQAAINRRDKRAARALASFFIKAAA